ncbi:DUF305 domain-containing protein [Streptomyces sp. NPDC002920]
MSNTRVRRCAALAAVAATATLLLTACGDEASDHNAQDVSFAQGMIPHHRQAVEMADLAADRASSAEVKDLAARIEKAQDPEIAKMTGWLKSWDEKATSTGGGMEGMDHSGMSSDMSADMGKLEKASGEAFDSEFLTMMIEHHEGAVTMAGTERDKGEDKAAKAMADDIVTGQSAEIAEMRKLLGSKG